MAPRAGAEFDTGGLRAGRWRSLTGHDQVLDAQHSGRSRSGNGGLRSHQRHPRHRVQLRAGKAGGQVRGAAARGAAAERSGQGVWRSNDGGGDGRHAAGVRAGVLAGLAVFGGGRLVVVRRPDRSPR